MNLAGKTALVTGSTSGIGLGIAKRLAEAGANLVLNGFGDAEPALAAVRAAGGQVRHHPADMARPEQIAELVAFVESEFGALDILVNNAGIQHVAPVDEFPPERWDSILAINLSSVFHTTRLALPGMRRRGWVVALETAQEPITCNAICPGWVLTPLVQQQIDERARADGDLERARHDLLAEKQPSLEFVTPEQLGELTLYLCSDAAAQVRGVAWNIDGGWAAR
jgi:3-hydroxybutyrate dehydrogenase